MFRKLLKFVIFSLCLGIFTLLISAGLFATESGSRWLINRLIVQYDIPLTIDKVKGHLLDEINFQGVHYLEQDGSIYQAKSIKLAWSPLDLLGLNLNVSSIFIDHLTIKLPDTSFSIPEIFKIDFPLLAINIQNLELKDTLVDDVGNIYLIENSRANLFTSNDKLLLQIEHIKTADQELVGSAALVRKKNPEIEIKLFWTGVIENKPGRANLHLAGLQNNLDLKFNLNSEITSIKAFGNLDLISNPHRGTLKGEISGKYPQVVGDYLDSSTAIVFDLKGDTNFIEGKFSTNLQSVSNEKLALEIESFIALPGPLSQSLNIKLDWWTTPEQENPSLTLSGEGNFEYLNEQLNIEHQLTAPYSIQLDGKAVFNNQPYLELKLDWKDIHLQVSDELDLQVPTGSLNVDGTLDSLDVQANTQFTLAKNNSDNSTEVTEIIYTRLVVDGKLNSTTDRPTGEFIGTIDGPIPGVLQQRVLELTPFNYHLNMDQKSVDLGITGSGLFANNEHFDVALNSNMEYSQDDEVLATDFEWSVTSKPGHLEHVAGNGSFHYQPDQLTITHELISPFPVKLVGDVTFNPESESTLRFDINWQDLKFPLQGYSPLQSEYGHVHLEGPVSSPAIRINSRIMSVPYGPADIDVVATWSDPTLNITGINIKALDGNLQGTGQLSMKETTRAQFDLNAHNINLASISGDLVSNINLVAKLDLVLEAEELNGHLQIPSISGNWRGHSLQGNADIARSANRIDIRSLHVESGNNAVDMQMKLHESLDGHIDLSIADMSVVASELAGTINGRFEIGGTQDSPQITGQLKGKDIAMPDLRIGSIEANSLIDLRSHQNSSLNIRSSNFQYNTYLFDEITLNGKGLTESHTLDLSASGENLQVTALLDGQLHNKQWKGSIKQLVINTSETGKWKLNQSADILLQGESTRFSVSSTCLGQNDATLCLEASGEVQKDITSTIQLNHLPMVMAQPWLPETVILNGTVSGDIFLNRLNQQWELQTSLEGNSTEITVGHEENTETVEIQQLSLKAESTENKREWYLQMSSSEYFDIRLNGSVQNTEAQPISADLLMNLYTIDWLAGIQPALTGSKGKFEGHVEATGTVDQPVIQGSFNLRDGQLSIFPLGLNLDRISGKIRSGNKPGQMLISMLLGNNDKQLEVDAEASLDAEENYPYQLQIFGENFPVVRTADMTMDVSPDLNLHGSLQLHHVRGNVLIPLLKMQVTSLNEDSVTVSPDTVIVQSKNAGSVQIEEKSSHSDFIRNRLDVDINVKFESDIQIKGFGLDTKLVGDINLLKPVGIYQPRGEGFLNLSDGSYRAYGQNLVIEKGQLQFAGPLDNPGINVYAYRPNLKVHPGVKVIGTVRQPKLSLYSKSALSDADTLSYLMIGHPITGVKSNEDANLLAQAAFALGSHESSVLTNQIESMFGLEELSVAAGDSNDFASVSATKHLSPNLTFKPSFNPFDQLWSFLFNYRITDHWSVQAESGATQGGDIIYSVDTNKVSDLFRNIWNFDE